MHQNTHKGTFIFDVLPKFGSNFQYILTEIKEFCDVFAFFSLCDWILVIYIYIFGLTQVTSLSKLRKTEENKKQVYLARVMLSAAILPASYT